MLAALLLSAAMASAAPVPDVVMGEYVVARAAQTPEVRTYGVGPCLGLALYDPEARVGALAHVSPPDDIRGSVDAMMRSLMGAGADPRRMTARVVGGWAGGDGLGTRFTSPRMLEELKAALLRYAITPDASQALRVVDMVPQGVKAVRSLRLDLATGALTDIPEGEPAPPGHGIVRDPSAPGLMRPHAASLSPGR